MPRPLRIHFPNACYHVMNRGAGRQKIFKNNSHRLMFLDLLKESHTMFNLKIYAYCLMDNHYHILISTPDANLSRVMRHVNGVYTQKFNRSTKTDGPLFRGRYKAQLVDNDGYQLEVSRYIHLNPVEAGLVSNPAKYKWSSYAAYLGLVTSPDWLSVDIIINQLHETKSLSHVKNYQQYVEEKINEEINVLPSIRNLTPIIGSESFKNAALLSIDASMTESCSSDIKRLRTIPEIEVIINQICLFFNISREALLYCKPGTHNWPKLACIYICRKIFGHTLRDISKLLGLYRYEAVSTAIYKCNARLQKNPRLSDELNIIIERITKLMQHSQKS